MVFVFNAKNSFYHINFIEQVRVHLCLTKRFDSDSVFVSQVQGQVLGQVLGLVQGQVQAQVQAQGSHHCQGQGQSQQIPGQSWYLSMFSW